MTDGITLRRRRFDFPHDAHRRRIGDFVDAVAAGRDPQVTGEEALKAHRLIDALTFDDLSRRSDQNG